MDIRANIMREPTWNYLKLNSVELELEKTRKDSFNLDYEDINSDDMRIAFSSKDYGVSKEVLEENSAYRNFNKFFELDGVTDSKIINLKLDNEYNNLVSKIDIHAKEGSSSSILINFTEDTDDKTYINSLIRANVEENAYLKLVVIVNLKDKSKNIQSIASIIGKNANLELGFIELGAKKSIVNIKNFLDGENAKLVQNGVYFKAEEEFLDILAVNEHNGVKTDSLAMFNGALKDKAVKNFRGIVDLKRGCEEADGKIGDYSMMLSNDVVNKSAPILLTEEKNVKGNHAASIGRLNREMLFYIMSRGFDKKTAQSMMLEASFTPTLDMVEDSDLRLELKEKVSHMNERV